VNSNDLANLLTNPNLKKVDDISSLITQKEEIQTTHVEKIKVNYDNIKPIELEEIGELQPQPEKILPPQNKSKSNINTKPQAQSFDLQKNLQDFLEKANKLKDKPMPILKGNKGEWSELYVFLKLLLDEYIYIGDANNPNIKHKNQKSEIERNTLKVFGVKRSGQTKDIIYKLVDAQDGYKRIILESPEGKRIASIKKKKQDLVEMLKKFGDILKNAKTSDEIEMSWLSPFLKELEINKIKSDNDKKQDIQLVLYDSLSKQYIHHSFSVKSEIGSAATLLNASNHTKFYYELSGNTALLTDDVIDAFNNFEESNKYKQRLTALKQLGINLNFSVDKTQEQSKTLVANLASENLALPTVIAEALLFAFKTGKRRLYDIVYYLEETNPLNIPSHMETKAYERMIKKFLIDTASGMMPSQYFTGVQDAGSGYLVLKKENGIFEVEGYFNNGDHGKENLKNYLISKTKLETPSTRAGTMPFGKIEKDEKTNKYYFSLNLQIRFTKRSYTMENILYTMNVLQQQKQTSILHNELVKIILSTEKQMKLF
jgi:hypothetical protein